MFKARISRLVALMVDLRCPWQDINLMDAAAMQQQPQEPWNVRGTLPLRDWLQKEQAVDDQDRLSCMGNVVFPKQARLGLHICTSSAMR